MGTHHSTTEEAVVRRVLLPLIVLPIAVVFSGAPLAQPADSPWPMFRHDASHTGRSGDYEGPPSCALSWSYDAGGEMFSSPCVGSDGSVFIGSLDNRTYALDSAGGLNWSYAAAYAVWSSPAVDVTGRVLFGSYDDQIYSIDSTGVLSWSYQAAHNVKGSPSISGGGRVYVGSQDNALYAINSSGAFLWSYRTDGAIDESSAVGSDGTVYAGSAENRLYAFDAGGGMAWSYQVNGNPTSPLVISIGRVFVGVGDTDDAIYALNSAGGLVWSYRTAVGIYSSPAIGSDGKAYIGSDDNRLYALGTAGTLAWSYQTGSIIESSAAIGSTGTVYVASSDNALYAIDSAGGLGWSYVANGDYYSSPAITGDGRLVVGSWGDGRVYCISAAPTITATPTVTPTRTPTRTPTPTPVPQAEVVLNGASFNAGSTFTATFVLNASIERPFTAYAVVVLPDGFMLDALTLGPEIVPVAENVPRLDAPFTYPLMNLNIPSGAPTGDYRVMAGFFTPGQPITKPEDAFLLATSPFTIR